jgi:YbbR domain-containing protein
MKKNKIFDLIIAILAALSLWMYVVTVVTPDDDIVITDIPVVFAGENTLRSENNLILTNRSHRTVTVTFHGSRVLLKQLSEERDSITAVVDVETLTSEREYASGYEIQLPTFLRSDQIQTVEYSPKTIQFTVEKMATRQIQVYGIFDGSVVDGYTAGDLVYDQNVIKITGPAEWVDQVSYAQVILGSEQDRPLSRTTTRDLGITLISKEGEPVRNEDISLSTNTVQVTLPVYLEKELPLEVNCIYDNSTEIGNTTVNIDPATITVVGEPDLVRDLTSISLGSLDLSQIMDNKPVIIPITLPSGVLSKAEKSTASVRVTFRGLDTTTVSVHNISTINVPDGKKAVVLDQYIPVLVRGPEDALEDYDYTTITVTADLSDYTVAGHYDVPVTVTVPNGVLAAVGSYTVSLELK